MSQITKSYGKGAIMKLGEHFAQRSEVTAISTGALPLDLALGVGGVPRGRVTEIYGPESAGKTTLALHVIAEAQKAGGVAAFVDAEHALDPLYASRIGVKIDDLLISQPDTGEQALEIVEVLVRSNAVDVIVIDSVGARVKVKVVKNKVAPPFRTAEFDILFNEGISREGALIDAAIEYSVLEKSGTWMSYGDQRLGQGRENVRNYLRENPTLSAEIEAKVREKAVAATPPLRVGGPVRAPASAPEDL